MLFLILILICLVLLIIRLKTSNYNYWGKKKVLQTEDLMWRFMFDNRSLAEICKSDYDKYDVPCIGTSLGTVPTLMLKTTEDIQAVFTGDFQSFHSRGIKTNSNDILADNLLFTEDFHKWKLLRQKLSPLFTSAKLKNMFFIIEKCARDFVEVIETDQNMRQNPFNALYTYTTSSIGASVFGIDTNTKRTMDSPFIDMAWKAVEPSLKSNITFFISSILPKLYQFLQLKIFGDHEDFFIGVVKNVLEERRCNPGKKRHDFIEVCLELQNSGMLRDPTTGYELSPTDELIAAQAFFFFIAGADTTATAMHFTLLELAGHPKVLNKLHEEIDSVFEPGKEELTHADIEKLQYLDMVISEAMRKYPPIGFIQRICTKDTVLPSHVNIEKDTAIVIPVYALHRDAKIFPKPEEFRPERFESDSSSEPQKYTYMPFGEGNRFCIGSRLARLQMKSGLAWLLRRFTLAEQEYNPQRFERSTFAIKDSTAHCKLIARNL